MTETEVGGHGDGSSTRTRSRSGTSARGEAGGRLGASVGLGLGRPGRRGLVIVTLLAIATLARVVPLYWSPHPATLDGFQYAWFAREALATGSYPIGEFRADSFVYTGLAAVVSGVAGVAPLRSIQPLSSLIGVGGVVVGVAVARRIAAEYGWSRRRVTSAAVAAGFVLALDGIYLRRTMVADEEVMSYVLWPLAVVALHLWLAGRRPARWGVVAGILLVTLPVLHIFSTFVAGLSVVALVAVHVVRNPDTRTVLGGGAVVAAFWLYFGGYYHIATSTALTVAYVDRVTAFPGLFLAWVILLVVGAAWLWTTDSRLRALVFLVPVGAFYAITTANVFVSVYPGTPLTPVGVLVPVVALLGPVLAAGYGLTRLSTTRPGSAVVVALLAAPLALVGFSLTASLTPEYVNTAIRGQTFGHLPVAILAGLVLSGLVARRPSPVLDIEPGTGRTVVRYLLVGLVLVSVVGSLPFAYLTLDTGTYPATTFDSEFRGVGFVATHTQGPWATDHSLSRVGILYFRSDASPAPTASWLSGGASPRCPVVSQESWTSTGAHLFPFAPDTVSPSTYDAWLSERSVVYANTGRDPVTVSLPVTASERGC